MTTSNDKQKKINVAQFISKNLLLRNSANLLFQHINEMDANKIILDFSKVEAVTRAFTHQYLLNRKKSEKKISDVNVPPEVNKMFKIIQKTDTHFQEPIP